MTSFKKILYTGVISLCLSNNVNATGINEKTLFYEDCTLNSKDKGKITLSADILNFFHNNEYWGGRTSGYTLPGFYIRPYIGFQPAKNIKIEAGIYLRHYWGAISYPQVYFRDVLRTVSNDSKNSIQIRPHIRVHAKIGKSVKLIFGNIYGGENHLLPEPLYNYERIMTEYPETGMQILADTRYLSLDTWINWESFIFRNDNHQEAFTFGVAARAKVNDEKEKYHIYFPINTVFQHRGGEIDTISGHRVQTWMNSSAGAGIVFNLKSKAVKRITAEATFAYYMEIEDNLMPFKKGYLLHGKVSADIWRFKIGTSFWKSYDFISLMGNPYYGSMYVPYNGNVLAKPEVGCINMEYAQRFGKSCILGFKADLYLTGECQNISGNGEISTLKKNIGFTAGAYFRFTPTFVLKRIKGKI